jgi:hypothetical protein
VGSLKNLQAVAHDLGHHAQSGLAYLFPHLGQVCLAAHTLEADVDLLAEQPYPSGLPQHGPLSLALASLRRRFFEILAKYDLEPDDVVAVQLHFMFPPAPRDHSIYAVRSSVTARSGRVYERALPPIVESTGQHPR